MRVCARDTHVRTWLVGYWRNCSHYVATTAFNAGIYVAWRRLNVNKFKLFVVCFCLVKIIGKLNTFKHTFIVFDGVYNESVICDCDDDFEASALRRCMWTYEHTRHFCLPIAYIIINDIHMTVITLNLPVLTMEYQ